jgi:hypothetical protein
MVNRGTNNERRQAHGGRSNAGGGGAFGSNGPTPALIWIGISHSRLFPRPGKGISMLSAYWHILTRAYHRSKENVIHTSQVMIPTSRVGEQGRMMLESNRVSRFQRPTSSPFSASDIHIGSACTTLTGLSRGIVPAAPKPPNIAKWSLMDARACRALIFTTPSR